MARSRRKRKKAQKEIALILVEGETEIEFYDKVCSIYLRNVAKKVRNLHGNFNIHGKVLDNIYTHIENNRRTKVRVYCCIDRENRYEHPPLDLSVIKKCIEADDMLRINVLSVDEIVATQMLESWLFHDVEGIFKFLRVQRKKRNAKRYKTIERLTDEDLSNLFRRYGRIYIKGKRCQNFVDNLDIKKIFDRCKELRDGINLILRKK
jgi:hypothetical protein